MPHDVIDWKPTVVQLLDLCPDVYSFYLNQNDVAQILWRHMVWTANKELTRFGFKP